ncbi:hypothetical protein EBI01_03915 [Marinomonas rhizomae]|jgi:hypothetical protein|uniref:ParE-like toxin domain-containing protein n=1 Tax=Marinomonas rhizomae TaxID=491948 RepID=A0A366JD18_9GAMM|nr:hypothetical protein DFP80_103190 [Marinomonas rhizomae]RNF75084.1 hypothetical protein EBI01_03915 [Marinomonas rhizomae]
MRSIVILGKCSNQILSKAMLLIRSLQSENVRYKKLSGLRRYSAIKINKNYRILLSPSGSIFVGSHSQYERKIKQLRKVGEGK